MKKISVIIPTFNRANYLKEAIQSILNQTYQDFEIIVTDNASTDHTQEVVENFKETKIKYIKNKENLGVVENHNIALRHCVGEFIHIFSDDDIMLPECLSLKINIFNKDSEIDFIHSNIKSINSEGEIISESHWANRYYYNWFSKHSTNNIFTSKEYLNILIRHWNIISMPSVMFKKELLINSSNFKSNVKYFCDWDLWLRLIYFSQKVYYISEITVLYRRHSNNLISEVTLDMMKLEYKEMKKNFLNIIKKESVSQFTPEFNLKKFKLYPIKNGSLNRIKKQYYKISLDVI